MEPTGTLLAAVGGLIVMIVGPFLALFGKVLLDERANVRTLADKHEDCLEKHAQQSELYGGVKEALRILTTNQPTEIRRDVVATIAASEAKVEARAEAKSEKKNGNGNGTH